MEREGSESLYTGFRRISDKFACDQNNGRELCLSEKNCKPVIRT